MPPTTLFDPPRHRGLVVHGAALVILGVLSVACLFMGLRQSVGGSFILLLLLSLAFFTVFLLMLYRGYALLRARYIVEREGLRLRWGLRVEDIPMQRVEWVRAVQDLPYNLPRPLISWPGALLGVVRVRELGPVEYLAASPETLLLIATPTRVYAISPADPRGFLRAFRAATELGSIEPLDSLSVQPVAYLNAIWQDKVARWMVALSLGLAGALFVLVSLIIPTRTSVSLGFDANGIPLTPVPSEQLLLLAVLGAFAVVIDLLGGLFFYRQADGQVPAYLLWGTGVLTPLLLLLAVGFIL
jgi:hypothetical protein